ncbi:MAG: hypothetical protein A2X86_11345 [Bdellovibrionales bacterium GWA2_49_15]|nr:MAG: hypothetical protein A2X86_11345 [Bdellovibrionales bacterium GWA2_49_15]HAZ12655.1 hypothetical protein [Bdellovibrionales bacterium]
MLKRLFLIGLITSLTSGHAGELALDDDNFSLAPKFEKRVETYRPGAYTLNKRAKEIFLKGDYFSKTSTLDKDGNNVPLGEGESYQEMNGIFGMNYGVGEKLEMGMEARFRNNQSETALGSASNSGVESLMIQSRYSLGREGAWSFAVGGWYRQALYTVKEYQYNEAPPANELVLGEGGADLALGGLMAFRFSSHHYLSTDVYYVRRPGHISPEIQYNAHMAWPYTKIAFILGADGIYSMGQDPYNSDLGRRPLRSTGATARYNSVNRSEVAPYLGINLSFSKIRFDLKASSVMAGASTDEGVTYSLAMVWGQTGISSQDKKLAKFKEYHVEGSVTKVSPRGKFLKIDQGIATDVEKGMKIDIFKTDFFGGNILVASGEVFEVGSDWAIVKILEQYRSDVPIDVGLTARGY